MGICNILLIYIRERESVRRYVNKPTLTKCFAIIDFGNIKTEIYFIRVAAVYNWFSNGASKLVQNEFIYHQQNQLLWLRSLIFLYTKFP